MMAPGRGGSSGHKIQITMGRGLVPPTFASTGGRRAISAGVHTVGSRVEGRAVFGKHSWDTKHFVGCQQTRLQEEDGEKECRRCEGRRGVISAWRQVQPSSYVRLPSPAIEADVGATRSRGVRRVGASTSADSSAEGGQRLGGSAIGVAGAVLAEEF